MTNRDSLDILMADIAFEITRRGGPENIIVMDHPKKKYVGNTFEELAEKMKKNPVEVAVQLALEGDKNCEEGVDSVGFPCLKWMLKPMLLNNG